jgi:hypothetical protein
VFRVTSPYDENIGPVILVTISDPFRDRNADDLPRTDTVRMLLDTGASDTAIAPDIAQRLGLRVFGLHEVSGFSAHEATYQYLADLELHLDGALYSLPDWRLLQFNTNYKKIDGLIGRDVLSRGRFLLDGINRKFTLEFDN